MRGVKAIKTKKRKKNNVVILINAEDKEELREIKEEFLISARKVSRKRELGFYIAPIEMASFEAIQNFGDFSLKETNLKLEKNNRLVAQKIRRVINSNFLTD